MKKLTKPQRDVLEVLSKGPARYSNSTGRDDGMGTATVYHQVTDRLVTAGFARFVDTDSSMMDGRQVEITRTGRNALGATDLGLSPS